MALNKFIIIFFLLLNFKSYAAEGLALGLSYELGGVVAEDNITNGSTGSAPSFHIGYKISKWTLEFSYIKHDMYHAEGEAENGDKFSLRLEDTIYRLWLKYEFLPFLDGYFGLTMHDIVAQYDKIGSDQPFDSNIDGVTGGYIIGAEAKAEFFPRFEGFSGIGLDKAREEVGILFFNFGLRYYVL